MYKAREPKSRGAMYTWARGWMIVMVCPKGPKLREVERGREEKGERKFRV